MFCSRLFVQAFLYALAFSVGFTATLSAQKTVAVISRCGGVDSLIIPSITDNDGDGMDDALESKLLNRFMPTIIQFSDESCPGPALDGTGDSNLVVCHIYPIPQQYALSNNLTSVQTHPVAVVGSKQLTPGLVWYNPLIMVNAAVLYGKDCGALGHTADVEGFSFSLRYTGTDTAAGWMYDTTMQNWMGVTIQTTSHASTPCEQIETLPYKSVLAPNGKDSVLASPDKHGNYLTKGGCNASFICNPGCNNTPSKKNVKPVNLGEDNASLVPDLGTYYPAYAGENPWGTSEFLSSQGGSAGAIRDKMLKPLSSDFVQGSVLTQAQICPLYEQCFGVSGSAYMDYTCAGTSYNFWGQQLTVAGSYNHIVTNSYGCDSTVTLVLSVLSPASSIINASICSGYSYNFNGQQLSNGGTYSDTLQSSSGCDSIVALQLSVYAVDTTFTTAHFCSGGMYNFYGQPLSAEGLYSNTLTGSNNCDSVIFLNLIQDSLPNVSWPTLPATVYITQDSLVLTGGQPPGGVYSGPWVYNGVFYADSSGLGTCSLTYTFTDSAGCSNSAYRTILVLYSGISETGNMPKPLVYPNPAGNELFVQLTNAGEVSALRILDEFGRIVWSSREKNNGILPIPLSALANGTYTLLMDGVQGRYSQKFLVVH